MTNPTLADRVKAELCDCDMGRGLVEPPAHWNSCASIVLGTRILALIERECERVRVETIEETTALYVRAQAAARAAARRNT